MKREVSCRCRAELEIKAGRGARVECESCREAVEGLDVFICHAAADQELVEPIARALEENELLWIGSSAGRDATRWQDRPEVAIARARVAVLLLSQPASRCNSVVEEIRAATESWHLPGALVYLDDTEPSGDLAFWSSTLDKIDARAASWRTKLTAALRIHLDGPDREPEDRGEELYREAETAALAPRPASVGVDRQDSPYIGPASFTAERSSLFFGRDTEAAALFEHIERYRTVLLYSPSGAGKSSLTDTKVRLYLERSGFEVLPLGRVGAVLPMPVDSVPESTNIYTFATLSSLDPEADEATCRGFLSHSLDRYLKGLPPPEADRGRVLILDQFEEIITKSYARPDDQWGFFQQLRVALSNAGESLRLVLVFRQEYLAEIEMFWGTLEDGKKYRLPRLGQESACEAVIGPAATKGVRFEPEVVEGLVHELSLVKERGRGGEVRIREGDYVEPVHLQIACDRLWQSLEPGLRVITAADVARAARRTSKPGRGTREADLAHDLSEFVGDVLNDFYEDVVRDAATDETQRRPSRETSGRGETEFTPEEELIHLACMQFVTAKGTRKMVLQDQERTGRLPNDIVTKLADKHLLRGELRGGERWYELAHDTLTQPIIAKRRNSVELIKLLNALDSLAALVKQAKADTDERLSGFFEAYEGVLHAVETFLARPGLYEDEAELICRSSLASGYLLNPWARRLHTDYPHILQRVVGEALRAGKEPSAEAGRTDAEALELRTKYATVRRHAAELLSGDFLTAPGAAAAGDTEDWHLGDLEEHLYELALDDAEDEVRASAAVSLAKLDREELSGRLKQELEDPGKRHQVIDVLARVKDQTLRHPGAGHFERRWPSFPRSVRRRILYKVAALRLHAGALRLIVVSLLCFVATPLITAVGRTPLAHWGWTQSQTHPGAARGMFHSMVGGVCWGVGITLALCLYWVVFQRGEPDPRNPRRLGPAVAGSLGGFLGGSLLTLIVVQVFEVDSLVGAGWLEEQRSSLLHSLLVETRLGLQFPFSGAFLGLGIAWMTVVAFYGERWQEFVAEQVESGPIMEAGRAWRALLHIVFTTWQSSWRVLVCLLIAGGLLYLFILQPGSGITEQFKSDRVQLLRQAGEILSLYMGSLGAVTGLSFALLILRVGIGAEFRGSKTEGN